MKAKPDPHRVELGWVWSFTSKYHLHAHIGQEYKGFPNPRPSTQRVRRKGLLSNCKRADSSREQSQEGGLCTSPPTWDGAGQQGVHSSPPRLLSRRLLFCRAGSGAEAGAVLAQRNRAPSVTEQPVRVAFGKALKFSSPWCVSGRDSYLLVSCLNPGVMLTSPVPLPGTHLLSYPSPILSDSLVGLFVCLCLNHCPWWKLNSLVNASGCWWLWEQHNLSYRDCVHTGTCANKDLLLKVLNRNRWSYTSVEGCVYNKGNHPLGFASLKTFHKGWNLGLSKCRNCPVWAVLVELSTLGLWQAYHSIGVSN